MVRAVDFNGTGLTGLAILTADGLFIYVPDGQGGFLPPTEYDVGFEPNGLTVANLNGNSDADLLISNPLGDVQVLIGNGNGTFQPVQNLDKEVGLAVYAPSGNTPAAFIFTDQATDQLVIQTAGGVTSVLGDAATGLISPGAVELADLNNNGILDLIVANSGSNNVLIYPGLGNGAFGPALNDGHGFFTGTDPVGITVADLTGNGRLDLIVSNQGSNDVSILLNVQVGNSFTFEQGPLLQAGVGPVSTVVADVLGSGVPDLVIANSGSNNLWVLPGVGNGFFNDQSPMIIPVGTNPTALFAGQFTTGLGQDLVTINSGSNTVTVISELGTLSPLTQTISSGGIDPTAAFAVPLTTNGAEGLVVANNADGNFSLFEPGDNGLALSSVFSSPGLPNPSALALASFNGANLEFYAATEGETSASLLGFQLEEGGAVSSPSISETGGAAQLVSLNESSLALVGTLLTLTLELQEEGEQSSEDASGVVASSGPGGAGQSLAGLARNSDEVETLDDATEENAAAAPPALSWARFVIGLDQAIEAIRNEIDSRLLQEEQPAKTQQPTQFSLTRTTQNARPRQRHSGNRQSGAPTAGSRPKRIKQTPSMQRSPRGDARSRSSQSVFPVLPDSTIARAPNRSFRVLELKDGATLFPSDDVDQLQLTEVQVSRAVTLVAFSTIAVKAHERLLKRSISRGRAAGPGVSVK